MEASTVIANLPPLTQLAVNLAIFIVTIIIAIKSYTNKKIAIQNEDDDDDIVDVDKNKRKFIVIIKSVEDHLHRIANSIEKIEENLTKETQTAEIEREVQRRIDQRLKRGATRNFSPPEE